MQTRVRVLCLRVATSVGSVCGRMVHVKDNATFGSVVFASCLTTGVMWMIAGFATTATGTVLNSPQSCTCFYGLKLLLVVCSHFASCSACVSLRRLEAEGALETNDTCYF